MAKGKKELLASAPWRVEEDEEKFKDAKLKVSNQPGSTPKMHIHHGNKNYENDQLPQDSLIQIDSELRYGLQRNFQFLCRVFSMDTILKPLPPAMAYNVSRNLTFFTRIFTQFNDPEGIENLQRSLGIGQEQKVRNVR